MLRWLVGLATSLIGNHIYLVTLAWVAVQTTTPANVGLILVAGAIPQAALLLVGGVFVDRIGPKLTIIASDVLRTLIMVVFAIVVAGGEVKPLLLGVLAVMFGVVDGFFLPAINSAPRYLVRRDSITRVVAAKTIVARGAEFAGAPLGSWLLVVASAAAAFWVNAWLFAVSVVLLAMTRMALPEEDAPGRDVPDAEPSSGMSVWADLRAGIRLIRGYRTLATLLIVVFVAEMGFSGPMIAGVPLLANETGWGVRTVGWVLGGFGLGAAAGAGFLLWRKTVHHTGFVALAGLTAMGLSVVGLGLLPTLGLPLSDIVRCRRTSRPYLWSGRRLLRHAGHLRCAAAGSDRSDRPGHECPVFFQHGRGPRHLRAHRAADGRLKCQSPISDWRALDPACRGSRLSEPGTTSADHRSHSPSGRATLAVSVCSTRVPPELERRSCP